MSTAMSNLLLRSSSPMNNQNLYNALSQAKSVRSSTVGNRSNNKLKEIILNNFVKKNVPTIQDPSNIREIEN